jgi:hypothetical protein
MEQKKLQVTNALFLSKELMKEETEHSLEILCTLWTEVREQGNNCYCNFSVI